MTDTCNQYVRTDEVDDALVTLDDLKIAFQVNRKTIERWITADGIERVPFGREKAVRIGDIPDESPDTTRWRRPKQ